MSDRGGKRNGAGRPAGSRNRRDLELLDQVLASGEETPLEFILKIMRDESEEVSRRMDAAKAAAPYVHPKLSATSAEVKASFCFEDILGQLIKK